MSPPTVNSDVVVVGGGPAGCATTIALRQAGVSCVLLERSSYDRPQFGESLPPAAKPFLCALGVWDQFLRDGHLPSPGNLSIWGDATPDETAFISDPQGSGWHLDRVRFDRMLFNAAAATTTAQAGLEAIDCRRVADGWDVTAGGSRGRVRYAARFLVDATGRRRSLARLTTLSAEVHDHLLAIVGMCRELEPPEGDRRTWVEAVEEGWWYTAPIPGRRIVVAFMTDATVLRSRRLPLTEFLDRQLGRTGITRSRLRRPDSWSNVTILSAPSCKSSRVAGADFLAVGDAAAAYDPLSSEGLCKALRDGFLAAHSINLHLRGDHEALPEYVTCISRQFSAFVRQHQWMYSLERRWPASKFWCGRQKAVAHEADSVAAR